MMDETQHMSPEDERLPADLAEVSARLDALSERDRAAAPRGMEDRLVSAAMSAPAPDAPEPELQSIRFPMLRTRPASSWRMAASLALSMGILGGVTWLSSRMPTTPTGTSTPSVALEDASELAEDLDQFLTSVASWDIGVSDSIESTREAIDLAASDRDFWGGAQSDTALWEDTL